MTLNLSFIQKLRSFYYVAFFILFNFILANEDKVKIEDQVKKQEATENIIIEDKKIENKENITLNAKPNNEACVPKKLPFMVVFGDHQIRSWVKLRIPEFFYGKNLKLLNNDNPTDREIYFRHTLDLNVEYKFTKPNSNCDIVFSKMNIRNKAVWGNNIIANTTFSDVKVVESLVGSHNHALTRQIFWIRELWIKISLKELLGIPFCNDHSISFGAFPFELGRGISLGASYKVDPTDLGFYGEVAVDQYAFGGLLSGTLIKDRLTYDLYAAILDNKSDSFNETNAKIRGQEIGHRNDQARGFGIINYVIAARCKWFPILHPNVNFYLEPYVLYNRNPEHKVEFIGDADCNLITLGLASEGAIGNFEWGFDAAFNLGNQNVHGWDRNIIKLENRDGFIIEVNSKINQISQQDFIDQNLNMDDPNLCKQIKSAAFNVKANQDIIDTSEQSVGQNGKIIGQTNLGILINDCERFINPYTNFLKGSMFVFDMGYNIKRHSLKFAWGLGFASGDRDPNRDLERVGDSQHNSNYYGFVGLQETYSGIRVKSAFLLSGSGKIPRILSFPSRNVTNPFVVSVNRFTNLIFTGASSYWSPTFTFHKWSFNPNILAYWQDHVTQFFDHDENGNLQRKSARSFLGTELNIFIESEFLDGLRFFGIGSVFFPGAHYKDIKGRPLNKAQQKFLENLNKTGIINDRVPLLGDDTAYFANIGLEYKF